MDYSYITERINRINSYIKEKGYDARIMAVTKSVNVEPILVAYDSGIRIFGENRWQVAKPKLEKLKSKGFNLDFFFIGHLQTNKVKYVVKNFKGIYSLDREELASYIDEYIERHSLSPIEVLIEVNVSGEESKYGVSENEVYKLYEFSKSMKNLRLKGIMAMGPLTDDTKKIENVFKKAREIFESIRKEDDTFDILSLGMSDDFHIALDQGSNLIRIGRGIFSEDAVLPI